MRIGRLRHLGTIQVDTKTRDTHGGLVHTWADLTNWWMSIEPLSGREILDADQVKGDVTHRIRMRYYSGLTPKHRIVYDSRIFNIETVHNVYERNAEMECLCREAV